MWIWYSVVLSEALRENIQEVTGDLALRSKSLTEIQGELRRKIDIQARPGRIHDKE